MNRGTMIASAAGAAGVLAATAFAGVAVYNAATVSSRADDAVVMAADLEPVVAEVSDLESSSALPELPEVPISPSPTEGAAAAVSPGGQEAAEAAESVESPAAPAITKARASRIALSEAPGEVMGVSPGSRNGYRAWAVQIKRPDGSIVTGYVDRASGVAFDWVIDQSASAATYSDDDEHEGMSGSDHEGNHEGEGSDDDD